MKRFIGGPSSAPLTPAIVNGPWLFLSGQVPTGADGKFPDGVEAQTKVVMEKIKALVAEAGFEMTDIVKATVFLRDISQFAAMNKVYASYFPTNPPTRSTIEAKLAIPIDVEIEAIAMKA